MIIMNTRDDSFYYRGHQLSDWILNLLSKELQLGQKQVSELLEEIRGTTTRNLN